MEADPKPRRRWFTFSLRTLLVVVTVVGTALSLTMREYREWRRRALYDAVIKKMDAPLYYYADDIPRPVTLSAEEWAVFKERSPELTPPPATH